jgi:hypothetical protein
MLTNPTSVDEIYLARDGAAPYRPLLQGDVFSDVTIPGVGIEHTLVIVATHPCTMRRGPVLVDRVKAHPVVPYDEVPLEKWGESHFKVFPLPQFRGGEPFAARFDEVGMVPTAELSLDRRVAILSDHGILLFQQRQIFTDTRAALKLGTLQQASAAVLAEAELLEEWNERLAIAGDPGNLLAAITSEAIEFDKFLGLSQSDLTLREMLRDEHRRSAVRKAVRAEIRRRSEEREGISGA